MKVRLIIIVLLSFIITAISPFLFSAYFEEQPKSLDQSIKFGGPFPFAVQDMQLPADESKYPIQLTFQSPIETDTTFSLGPFLLSFVSFFILLFSLSIIISHYFKLGAKKIDPS